MYTLVTNRVVPQHKLEDLFVWVRKEIELLGFVLPDDIHVILYWHPEEKDSWRGLANTADGEGYVTVELGTKQRARIDVQKSEEGYVLQVLKGDLYLVKGLAHELLHLTTEHLDHPTIEVIAHLITHKYKKKRKEVRWYHTVPALLRSVLYWVRGN